MDFHGALYSEVEIDALVHTCDLTVTEPDNWSLKMKYELESTQ